MWYCIIYNACTALNSSVYGVWIALHMHKLDVVLLNFLLRLLLLVACFCDIRSDYSINSGKRCINMHILMWKIAMAAATSLSPPPPPQKCYSALKKKRDTLIREQHCSQCLSAFYGYIIGTFIDNSLFRRSAAIFATIDNVWCRVNYLKWASTLNALSCCRLHFFLCSILQPQS